MPEKLRSFGSQLLKFWHELPTVKRVALVVVTLTVLLGVLAIAHLGSRVRYAYLYTDLEPGDAAAIVEKLKTQKVPYRLAGDGRALEVPEERVAALRLELASNGLPRGSGVGFEIFDRSQIGATEFEQQVSLRRALEGELSRSIMTMHGVRAARVHLVMPERRLFAGRDETASASVVLTLSRPGEYGKKEVAAIVHLVATAIPGLNRSRVSVVSSEGVTLHRPSGDDATGPDAEHHAELGEEMARRLENDVQAQLERVVGPGQADVRVHVTLDRESRERTAEHYEPSKTSLRSEHKVEELSGSGAPGVAGVPGARSNLPETAPEAGAQQKEAETPEGLVRRVQTRNWEVDRVLEKSVTPAGGIRRLSVAVLLNGRYERRGDKQVYVERSAAELAKLESIVKSAVGFDAERGDVVQIANAEFARPPEEPPAPPPEPLLPRERILPYAGAALGALALLALVVSIARRARRRRQQAEAPAPAPVLVGVQAAPELAAPEAAEIMATNPLDDLAELRTRALELANKDPASAAVVLRSWLHAD